jgi:thiosulfate dehydrogenase [quinone] large subunit
MRSNEILIPEPPLSRFLFADSRLGWLWLIARLYVGYEWIMAGWEKVSGGGWLGFGQGAGAALQGFLQGALAKTAGAHPDVSSWYGWFLTNVALPHAALFANIVALGECAVGIGLILGAFTGIAAFAGAFMNLNYLFAGTVSINPLLLVIELFLILAWRSAGWLGLDRWLLPLLGVPWAPGKAFGK